MFINCFKITFYKELMNMKKIFIVAMLLVMGFVFAPWMQTSSAGNGSSEDPFLVETYEDLCKVGTGTDGWNMDRYYLQTANIQCPTDPQNNFLPIGTSANRFTGCYDGDNYTISNLYIYYAQHYAGLFGYVGNGGILENIGLESAYVTQAVGKQYIGSLVGYNYYGTIQYCYAKGYVSGTEQVGGLIGYNHYGTIHDCYARADVAAISSVMRRAGFIGQNHRGPISHCYAEGTVTPMGPSHDGLGGFCGSISLGGYYADIYNFYDNETFGLDCSAMGTGKYTSDMKTQSTFTDWDFTDVWGIHPNINDGYPFLRWEKHLRGLMFLNPNPENRSWCERRTLSAWNITIIELGGNTFNWSITTSPNVGSSSGTNETNGSKTVSLAGLQYKRIYHVYVHAESTDGWKNATYWFRVRDTANLCISQVPIRMDPIPNISPPPIQPATYDNQNDDGGATPSTPGFELLLFIATAIAFICVSNSKRGKRQK